MDSSFKGEEVRRGPVEVRMMEVAVASASLASLGRPVTVGLLEWAL